MNITIFHTVDIFRTFYLSLYTPTYYMLTNNWEQEISRENNVTHFPTKEITDCISMRWEQKTFYIKLKTMLIEKLEENPVNTRATLEVVPILNYLIAHPDIIKDVKNDTDFTTKSIKIYNFIRFIKKVFAVIFTNFRLNDLGNPIFNNNSARITENELKELNEFYKLFIDDFDFISNSNSDLALFFGVFPDDLKTYCYWSNILKKDESAYVLFIQAEMTSLFRSQYFVRDSMPEYVFDYIDGFTLYEDYSEQTILDVVNVIKTEGDFEKIENVISYNEKQQKTHYIIPKEQHIQGFVKLLELQPAQNSYLNFSYDAKFTQKKFNQCYIIHPLKQKCYWNSCYFCTINNKKLIKEDCVQEDKRLSNLIDVIKHGAIKGVKKYGIFCEAFSKEFLTRFCEQLTKEQLQVEWFFEGRVEVLKEVSFIERLYKSGCRGVVLGLESFNQKLMGCMNKGSLEDNEIHLILKTCSKFGIHVHLNIMIGFPNETEEEVKMTFEKLEYYFSEFGNITFDINIFYLGKESYINKNYSQFNIEQVEEKPNDILNLSLKWVNKQGISSDLIEKKCKEIRHKFIESILGRNMYYNLNILDRMSFLNRNLLTSLNFNNKNDLHTMKLGEVDNNELRVDDYNEYSFMKDKALLVNYKHFTSRVVSKNEE